MTGSAVLIPCRLDDTSPPQLIADVKYADFRRAFRSGLRDLQDGVAIRENRDWQAMLHGLRDELLSLTPSHLHLFVHHFRQHDEYLIPDWRVTTGGWAPLTALADLGLVEACGFKSHEVRYRVTVRGSFILEHLVPLLPEKVLLELNDGGERGVEPRIP